MVGKTGTLGVTGKDSNDLLDNKFEYRSNFVTSFLKYADIYLRYLSNLLNFRYPPAISANPQLLKFLIYSVYTYMADIKLNIIKTICNGELFN